MQKKHFFFIKGKNGRKNGPLRSVEGGGGYPDGVEERAERFVAEVEGLELMMRQVCANTCRIAVRARI